MYDIVAVKVMKSFQQLLDNNGSIIRAKRIPNIQQLLKVCLAVFHDYVDVKHWTVWPNNVLTTKKSDNVPMMKNCHNMKLPLQHRNCNLQYLSILVKCVL